MEAFYDGDLKDIWDSDLDPTESLKISTDHDMNDWFLERDVKDPAVILNDKLISDALLNGTLPIKSEHSYSLNSDGDSLPESPRSLQTKMDDMDDECYPAISLKTATNNLHHVGNATIDPKCLSLHSSANLNCAPTNLTSLKGIARSTNAMLNNNAITLPIATSSLNRISNTNMAFNLHSIEPQQHLNLKTNCSSLADIQATQHYLPQKFSRIYENDCSSVSTRDGSTSPDICSDIEIDESCIKDEPLSPNSSCPASPRDPQNCELNVVNTALSLNAMKMSSLNNTDLVLEHKNGTIQFTTSPQKTLKSEQLLLGATVPTGIDTALVSIKSEKEAVLTPAIPPRNTNSTYGIPLTPPSSLPSDESEGNLSPEHMFSPLSPNNCTSALISVATIPANESTTDITGTSIEQITRRSNSSTSSLNVRSSTSSTSTRQPIHTPLISSQPKGSTGSLLLTEEEKRTLLAEGYPIPQKLPLTKAEEKSLKKIRRKIKNKISAQESRRKKKEYMDQLERRVEILVSENNDYKRRVDLLEDTNASLLNQLQKLQTLVRKA